MSEEQKQPEEVVIEEPVAEEAAEEATEEAPAAEYEPFTLEKGKERAADAVDYVKQAGKEVTTRPILDAIGSYFTRGVDALIGLADGMSGKRDLRDTKKNRDE